jgi:hypothetical protein
VFGRPGRPLRCSVLFAPSVPHKVPCCGKRATMFEGPPAGNVLTQGQPPCVRATLSRSMCGSLPTPYGAKRCPHAGPG